MDKSWTKITNKVDQKFMQGAIDFAEMAKGYVDNKGLTHCPCKSCLNVLKQPPHLVSHHIIHNGFQQSYEKWTFHGESRLANETDDEGDETEDDSQTTALVASSCENFEFPREDGEEELVEIVDDEIVLDDLDDFVDDDTLSDEIVEELPEGSLEDVDDSNKTKMALYDESDDE